MFEENERRPIEGSGGKYFITASGDVFGPRGKLKPTLMRVGYYSVALSLGNGRVKREYVHKLVAQSFLGEIPKNHVINHIDGVKVNNKLSNLEIVSRKQNAKAWVDLGRRVNPKAGLGSSECPLGHTYKTYPGGRKHCPACQKMTEREKLMMQGLRIEDFKVLDFAPNYAVDRSGQVLSLKLNRLLKPGVNGPGYQYVNLKTKEGLRKNFALHRLVFQMFVGEIKIDSVIDHIDSNKFNNSVDNLRETSRSGNMKSMQDVRRKSGFGHKFTENQVRGFITELQKDAAEGKSIASSARKLGISYSFASDLLHRRKWKHLQFR